MHSGNHRCNVTDSNIGEHPHRLMPAAAFAFACALPLFWLSAFCLIFKDRMRMLVGSVDTIWSSAGSKKARSESLLARQRLGHVCGVARVLVLFDQTVTIKKCSISPGGSVLCWQT